MLFYAKALKVPFLAACGAGNALDLLCNRLTFYRLLIVMFLRLTVLETSHVTGCPSIVSDEKEPLASPIEDYDNSCDGLLSPSKALQQFQEGHLFQMGQGALALNQ